MVKTKYYSYRKGSLCKGCQQCVKGEKLVVFITGRCSNSCFYCPLSEEKKNKDVIFANEWPLKDDSDEEFKKIIQEAKLCNSKGAGITGGDPLVVIDRTIRVIKLLKKTFGKNFHIHLYTPLRLVTKENLKKLYEAGLDEIRFHPTIDDDSEWGTMNLAKEFKWKVGVEIPAVPLKEYYPLYLRLLNYLPDRNIGFLNINELEYSDTNAQALAGKNLHVVDDISYAIKGSKELALDLLKKSKIPTHFCTAKLKDKVQLGNRMKRRAKNVKQKFDKVDSEGMLTRGAIYLEEIYPSSGYRKRLKMLIEDQEKRKELLDKLEKLVVHISKTFKVDKRMIKIDETKLRLLTSVAVAKKVGKTIYYKAAIVKEYPTWDQMELEIEMV